MKTYKKYALYGSLRKDLIRDRYGNRWADATNFLEEAHKVKGIDLRDNGSYPEAQLSDDKERVLLVDIAEFTEEQVRDTIYRMEVMAGYRLDEVMVNGEPVGIYLIPKEDDISYKKLVESGDWATYYKEKTKY